ncbi:glutamate racemase [Sediminispirochaeta smaragdinae]|uniref:Glutamate racemase n=1 Tax=Sediminispirochaeta smaragdinae (strain DSM 11293 / JCM 15392 / SEBR 4228) TaxID=573413 RepID=E1R3F0_SEDSS|nr:glutamate racemase [Sediminispirochaeta smaragdinae]ADK81581.1 glutamate racemase [Sediminispirochaeta smaragdinae DSM 11293]
MKNTGPIAFFDSGIGGLPYLQWVRKKLPNFSYRYLADRANFPYGEKSIEELGGLIIGSMERYIERVDPSIVVVACNTASVTALQKLRDTFSVPFVGVVPAIKPAAALSCTHTIGLLATKRTVEDPYTDNLVRLFADGFQVERFAGVDIVDFVENHLLDAEPHEIREVLAPAVAFFSEKEVDTLVLGCTHFLHVRDEIAEAFGGRVKIVDSIEGVGRHVIQMVSEYHGGGGGGEFFVSGIEGAVDTYRRFADAYALGWGGVV